LAGDRKGTGKFIGTALDCRAHYVGSFTASKWTEYAVKLSRRRWQGGTNAGSFYVNSFKCTSNLIFFLIFMCSSKSFAKNSSRNQNKSTKEDFPQFEVKFS
jgi:hypothetical protein